MPVPSMLAAAAVVAGLGGAVALLGHRNPGFRQPRPWLLAMAAGMVAGGVSGGAVDLVLAGALIGAVAGTGMGVALRVARSAAVLWDRRRQLPLAPGEVVYQLDGREMEVTLEAAGPAGSEGPTRHSEYREMTGDGWRVTQLSGSCWEGTKGRAQLLGRRRADLLEVIEVLHPEAPGGSRVVASPPGLEAVRVGVAGGSRAMQQPTRLG